MLGRLQPERSAEEEDSRKGPNEGRGCSGLVQGGVDGHDELDETLGKGKGKGHGGKGEHGSKEDSEAKERNRPPGC